MTAHALHCRRDFGDIMRVLHVIDSLRLAKGGTSFAVREMTYWMTRLGLDTSIVCCAADETTNTGAPKDSSEVAVHELPRDGSKLLLGDPPESLRALIANADIVHIHGVWDPILVSAGKAARSAGKPLICTPHGMLAPWPMARHRLRKWPYYQLFTRKLVESANALHFITQAEARLAGKWTPQGMPTFIVPYFLGAEYYQDPPERDAALKYFPQVPTAGPWILFLSRIHPKKGLPRLIEAFPSVLKEFPESQLLIAGSGAPSYERKMRKMVAAAGIAGSTHFLGMVQGAAKVALYRRATILAIPSSQENFGIVFAESVACCTPVLLTPQVDLHHEIMAAGAGFLTQTSAAAVARDLPAALRDPAKLTAAGEAGRRWAMEHLRPERVAKAMLENYERVLSGSKTHQPRS